MKLVSTLFLLSGLCLMATHKAGGQVTCHCSTCSSGVCTGEQCFLEIYFNQTIEEAGCFSLSSSHTQCSPTTSSTIVFCCNHSDYCNGFPSTESPGGATDSPGDGVSVPPVIVPDGETPPTTVPTPTPEQVSLSCYRSDPSDDNLRICQLTNYGCYSTLRRTMNGSIISRRGCSRVPCLNETRNRKVKRCCYAHLCNLELSVEEYFPSTSTQSPDSTMDPPPAPTTRPNTGGFTPDSSFRPPVLTPLSSTTSAPRVTPPQQLHCHCQSGSCFEIMGTRLCNPHYACAIEYQISRGEVIGHSSMCVDEGSGCGLVTPNLYRACCTTQLCNQDPDYGSVPDHLLSTPTVPASTTPPTSTDPIGPTARPSDTDYQYTIVTIVFSVVGFIIFLLLVAIITASICLKVRSRVTKTTTLTPAPPHATNKQCEMVLMDRTDSGYHDDKDDAGGVSVQSSVSSASTLHIKHLMTSV